MAFPDSFQSYLLSGSPGGLFYKVSYKNPSPNGLSTHVYIDSIMALTKILLLPFLLIFDGTSYSSQMSFPLVGNPS
jgi:hypothetical protein